MGKTKLVFWREFSSRVRKKSFVLVTLLAPLLLAGVFMVPAYLASLPGKDRIITVLDESLLLKLDKGNQEVRFRYLPPHKYDLAKAKKYFNQSDDYALLYIPASSGGDPDFLARNIQMFRYGDISLSVQQYLTRKIETYLRREKLKAEGVDPAIVAQTKTNVTLKTINLKNDTTGSNITVIKMAVGYIAGLLIFLFVQIYGVQVARNVVEEKSSRIIEIIISSVKPSSFLMGKILGTAAVALLQFFIWVLLGGLIISLASSFLLQAQIDPAQVATNTPLSETQKQVFETLRNLQNINFSLIIPVFAFYFLGGYLLYASLFAAVGSAADTDTDTQQFIGPITIPILLSLVVLMYSLDNPDSSLTFWTSLIPFTSPVVMMARLPFGVPGWELLLSMAILTLSFLLMVRLSAKIYRSTILLYGKKMNLKLLWRLLRD